MWKTALFLQTSTCTWLHSRDLLLYHSRLIGLALRLPRSCLSMPPRNLCHAGGSCAGSRPLVTFLGLFFGVPDCFDQPTLCLCDRCPSTSPVVSFAGCVVFGIRLSTLEHSGVSGNQYTSQSQHVGVENGSNNLMLAMTWLNGNFCMYVCPSCTIQMTEWICWCKPFWIQRGESYQKEYLEEW